MKRKGKRIQEIQEKKRKENLQDLIFYQKPRVPTKKGYNSLQDWSLYRVSPKVKYHHALKKALNKEGKSGKRRKQKQKVNKKGREKISHTSISHQCEMSHFSHPNANFLILVRIFLVMFFFCSSSTSDF